MHHPDHGCRVMNFLTLQVRSTAAVSYVRESTSSQSGAAPGTPRLPHLTFRPPGLRYVGGVQADTMAEQLFSRVGDRRYHNPADSAPILISLLVAKLCHTGIIRHPVQLTNMHVQAVAAAVFSSLDDAAQKEYLLRPDARSAIVEQRGGTACTLAGASGLAERLADRSFAVLHYQLAHDGSIMPCVLGTSAASAGCASAAPALTPKGLHQYAGGGARNVLRC